MLIAGPKWYREPAAVRLVRLVNRRVFAMAGIEGEGLYAIIRIFF
jgi:hypothetical protein